ncbi:MAG: T9SS C-terminal target domain-containing protein [Bacteroidetes bacterium]|nr:MAG: T9SS C-terminal target domain-containing protein [Bacteroidota bacterium]MBL1144063.1 T9SS C-terminal target domain-containing protein [Bacteroidota bacterium]NOG56863.1 T9SS type A sorting domain-containing protein [Bacteroidota bacterium]
MKKSILSTGLFLLSFSLLFSQQILFQENFNAATLPTGWSNNAVSGSHAWSFGIDGSLGTHAGSQNLDGTAMAFFDDDFLGGTSTNNRAVLTSPSFDNSQFFKSTLEFDYNYRHVAGLVDSFKVEVFDGSNWHLVKSVTRDDCGNYLTGMCLVRFPHANIDISAFKNANCKVRFTYFDGNDWGWYVGIDNVTIFGQVAYNMACIKIETPYSDCGLNASEQVSVLYKNAGADTAKNISVSYQLDQQSVVNETIPYIAPGDSVYHQFTPLINLSALGNYNLKAFCSLAGDSDNLNDTIRETITKSNLNSSSYSTSFEANANDWRSSGINSSWQIGSSTNNEFATNAGSLALYTNPNGFYNTNEASFYTSPCFDFSSYSGTPVLEFLLNYDLSSINDTIRIEYTTNSGTSWQILNGTSNTYNWYNNSASTAWTGNSEGWKRASIVLSNLVGNNNVRFRFAFTSGTTANSFGVGIDAISINDNSNTDVSLVKINYPNRVAKNLCGYYITNPEITIKNNSRNAINTIQVSYSLNGGSPIIETMNTTISPNGLANYTFNTGDTLVIDSINSFDFWIYAVGDNNTINDTLYNYKIDNSIYGNTQIPFLTTFDNAAPNGWSRIGFTLGSIKSFNFTSSFSYTSKLFGGFGNVGKYLYPSSTTAGELTSPIIDLKNLDNPQLSFWFFNLGNANSSYYLRIEIFVLETNTWHQALPIMNYKTNVFKEEWNEYLYDLDSFKLKHIKIRFKYPTITPNYAFVFDHIKVYDKIKQDVGIIALEQKKLCFNQPTKVVATIINEGSASINSNSINISYNYNGGALQTETIPDSIGIDDTLQYELLIQPASGTKVKAEAIINLFSDCIISNDTITSDSLEMNGLYYFEDFENEILEYNRYDNKLKTPLKSGITLKAANNSRWYVTNGAIVRRGRGPSTDHTTSTSLGKYLILSQASFSTRSTSSFTLPCVDLTNSIEPFLSFWVHKTNHEKLYIDVFDGQNWHLRVDSVVNRLQTSYQEPWKLKVISLKDTSFIGKVVSIRFSGMVDHSPISIDDMSVNEGFKYDLTLSNLTSPVTNNCKSTSVPLIVNIKNVGLDTIDFTQNMCRLVVNLTGVITQNYLDTIANNQFNQGLPLLPGDSMDVLIDTINMNISGDYFISSTILINNDFNPSDNYKSQFFKIKPNRLGSISVTYKKTQQNNNCDTRNAYIYLHDVIGIPQWQFYQNGTWIDLSGETDTVLVVSVQNEGFYRANLCNQIISDSVFISGMVSLSQLAGDSIVVNCGDTAEFKVYPINSSMDSLYWYNSPTSTTPFFVGDTVFKKRNSPVNSNTTDTIYVEGLLKSYIKVGSYTINPNIHSKVILNSDHEVRFQINNPLVFYSIEMEYNSATAGTGVIQIVDLSINNIIFNKVYNLPASPTDRWEELVLDLSFSPGSYALTYMKSLSSIKNVYTYSHPVNPMIHYDSSMIITSRFSYNANWKTEEVCRTNRTAIPLYADCLVGIENDNLDVPTVDIYPNPTTNELNFSLNKEYHSIEVYVLNISGSIVSRSKFDNKSNFNLNIEGVKGLYFVRLILNNKENIIKKVVKH